MRGRLKIWWPRSVPSIRRPNLRRLSVGGISIEEDAEFGIRNPVVWREPDRLTKQYLGVASIPFGSRKFRQTEAGERILRIQAGGVVELGSGLLPHTGNERRVAQRNAAGSQIGRQ